MTIFAPPPLALLERRLLPAANPSAEDRKCAWDELLAAGVQEQLARYIGRHNHTGAAHDDIVQDVLVLAFRKVEQGKYVPGPVGILGWMFRIARYKILEAAREQDHLFLNDLEEVLPDLRASRVSAEYQATRAVLAQALDQLPERSRKIVFLSVFYHYTSDEIAHQLDIRADLVRKHKSNALQALRRLLASEFPERNGQVA